MGQILDVYDNDDDDDDDELKNEMGGAGSTYGERSAVYRVLMGKPKGKKPLRIPKL
jgi:hypothetical protein